MGGILRSQGTELTNPRTVLSWGRSFTFAVLSKKSEGSARTSMRMRVAQALDTS